MGTTAGANLGRKSVIVTEAIALVSNVWAFLGNLDKMLNRKAGELELITVDPALLIDCGQMNYFSNELTPVTVA